MSTGQMSVLVLMLFWVRLTVFSRPSDDLQWNSTQPRLRVSHSDLRNGSALFWEAQLSAGFEVLLLDQDQDQDQDQDLVQDQDQDLLLVGGRDNIYLLKMDSLNMNVTTIGWSADRQSVRHCLMAGKVLETDCANFVRLLQSFNKTSVLVCGTGAFNPQCALLHTLLNVKSTESSFRVSPIDQSGRGMCPFSPTEPFTARLIGGELFAGTSVDFLGANTAVLRMSVLGSHQRHVRTEQFDNNWLYEPHFVGSVSVPDSHRPDDDKIYLFFRERAVEASPMDRKVYSRVARVCRTDIGGKRSLINRWTTFLKARLLCSVPDPSGVDTHFDELGDIFVLETKEPQNPTIYGVFSSSSSVLRGSAVCMFSMASLRAAFRGPFAHKESPDHLWAEFKGHVPEPRPGSCPSEMYGPRYNSTTDLPDDVVSFMRKHQLMWEPVRPVGGRPVFTRVSTSMMTRVVVDRVEAGDGQYDVLHLGTDDGKVLKVVLVPKKDLELEAVYLEEISVFQSPTPILSMKLSPKTQCVFVSSEVGVARLRLHHCGLYGSSCSDCIMSRDPYCAWDGLSCSTVTPRRQDVKHGDPWSQCSVAERDWDPVEVKEVYGVEGNSSFLECVPLSPQTEIRWKRQISDVHQQSLREAHHGNQLGAVHGERFLRTSRGLLIQRLERSDAAVYLCTAMERMYSRVLTQYRLHVVPARTLTLTRPRPGRNYERCEQLWFFHKKLRQEKLRSLKLKQENQTSRVRRNDHN